MKKQAGFTLIELVIVIIILGILAATAIPKFVDLQGDARESSLKGVKAALEGGATLTYSVAAIEGLEKISAGASTRDGVAIAYGYPTATSAGIMSAIELDADDWTVSYSTGVATISGYVSGGTPTAECNVTYTETTSRPTIKVDANKC